MLLAQCSRQVRKWLLLFGTVLLIGLYGYFNPSQHSFFPKCPFRQITGFECSGCGSQRAAHYLLNFKPGLAFNENPLFMLAIPYVLMGFAIDIIEKPNALLIKLSRVFYGKNASIIVLIVILSFWILRNLF